MERLRSIMANKLDVHVSSRFRFRGHRKQQSLTRSECEEAVMRRLSHSQGLRQTLEWAVEARPHHVPVAHTFWHGPAKARPQLPSYGRDGLRSAVRQGLQVIIWAYQDLVDLPAGVQQKAAREWLPWPTFKACLQRGIPIVHIADHIRCKALSRSGGWFVDVDTLWLASVVPGSGVRPHMRKALVLAAAYGAAMAMCSRHFACAQLAGSPLEAMVFVPM